MPTLLRIGTGAAVSLLGLIGCQSPAADRPPFAGGAPSPDVPDERAGERSPRPRPDASATVTAIEDLDAERSRRDETAADAAFAPSDRTIDEAGTDAEARSPDAGRSEAAPPCVPLDFPIAFVSDRVPPDAERQLLVTSTDGSTLRRVYPFGHVAGPTWSPDGHGIAFLFLPAPPDAPLPTLRLLDPADGSVVVLARLERDAATEVELGAPSWSPDGQQIAFADHAPGEPSRIWIASRAGGPPRIALPGLERPQSAPDWSPSDPDRIAFVSSSVGSQRGLWQARLSEPTRAEPLLDVPAEWIGRPRWSPNGRRLAFAAVLATGDAGGADPELFVLDVETRRLARLSDNDSTERYPAWSPEGDRIVLSSSLARRAGQGLGLWVVPVDRPRDAVPITPGGGTDLWPDWYRGSDCGPRD